MRKKLNNALKALRGNRGSGIVLVLVCMICVSVLGTMLLYLSYTGFMLKVTERQSKSDLYNATKAMDEIRAGLQQAASDSITDAYKTVLINYSNAEFVQGITMEKKFQSEFVTNLEKWEKGGKKLINSSGTLSGTYNADVLAGFTQGATVGNGAVTGVADITPKNEAPNCVTLKGVCVVYTDAKGYTTSVTSDIAISAPSFNYIVSNYSVSGLQSYALIAKNALTTAITSTNAVEGSAYAGAINANSKMSMDKGTVVCKGNVSVSQNGILTMTADTNLWAGRVTVGTGSGLSLNGSNYVRDDLELAGFNAKASLSGSYYGFGNSSNKADESSAILANGRGTQLDLSGLHQLMLAGHSFISDSNMNPANSSDILMGESTSVRGNQMAYMVPVNCLDGADTNPLVYTGSQPSVSLKSNATINGKSFDSYGATLKSVYASYPGATGQYRAYYFIQFDTTAHANEFFKDYFTANKTKITSYLDQYITLTNTVGTTQSASYTLKKTDSGYELVPAAGDFSTSSAQMISTFRQLTSTLFDSAADGTYDNPYDYFVNTEKAQALGAGGQKNFGATGVVVNNAGGEAYVLSSNNLRVVIASGDVDVTTDFHGLIISGGTIKLESGVSLYAADAEVTATFAATSGEDVLGSYLSHGASGSGKTDDPGNNAGWNMDKLVSYKNWQKN